MIVPSIDIRGGQAVQLIGGRDLAIEAGDPLVWADRFGRVGEVAVVDLDAALGTGDNTAIIEAVAARADVRVGGGIRSAQAALAWLDRGVAQVVIGTAATPEVLSKLPPERVVVALDAVDGEVVVEGWRTRTGRSVAERMRELEGLCGGFLVTFVEREGRLGGTAMDKVGALVDAAGSARLTVAGGITTAAEVGALGRLGVESQVGMALYSGRMDLGEAFAATLVSDRPDGLIPTLVTDTRGVALGLCYSSAESLAEALRTGTGVYQSRKRGLWRKGATSGNVQRLRRVRVDCDRDALCFEVEQQGSFCHLDTRSCFGADRGLGALERTLSRRIAEAPAGSYTRRLLDDPELLASKLIEEARELAEARTAEEVALEAADVTYFASVAMARAGVTYAEVEDVLDRRARRLTRRPGDAKPAVGPETFASLRRLEPSEVRASRVEPVEPEALAAVVPILEEVEREGMVAVRRYAERFGDLRPGERVVLGPAELKEALDSLPADDRGVLERAAARIRRFAEAQRDALGAVEVPVDGGVASARLQPMRRAGCYAPGGRFPLPSSVLMTAVTARVAGVQEVWVASPRPTTVTLAAAALAGADGFLAVGGAQAIAALAFGAGDVPPCDVLCGPGNRYVNAAKQALAGRVAIDVPAGPSEILVIADQADPEVVAADLLAQAEHDPDARVTLLAVEAGQIEAVDSALREQLAELPTRSTAEIALCRGGRAIVAESWDEVVSIANLLAPEHLELQGLGAEAIAPRLTEYGALFIGEGAAEVFGDYGVGPNHVLPTSGAARSFGGLSVLSFLRVQTQLALKPTAELRDDCARLARLEGLEAHARAALARRPV